MENKLAVKCCKYLLNQGIISIHEEEIYVYGFELLFSFLLSTATILIIGIILGEIVNTLIFLCLFIFIRQCTGGFHAKTHFHCQLCTICFYLTVILLSIHTLIQPWYFALLAIAGGIVILWIGPIENPNKPLTIQVRYKNKWGSFFLFELAVALGWSGYFQFLNCNTIFYTLSLIIILMIIPKLLERRKYK